MHAVVIHAPHDLRIEARPAGAPGPGELRIRIAAGGICGSDLHYYHHGGFGTVRVKAPMVLGHEVAGTVEAVGDGVEGWAAGDRAAVDPSLPCGACRYCAAGQQHHCLDMRFYGSAMRTPHVDGGFREILVASARQCHRVPDGLSIGQAAMAEPLSVCLHAVRRAGPMLGARVLVTGCGPIGALCAMVARRAGAAEIVMTDVTDAALARVARLGADRTVNVITDKDAMAGYARDKGTFDVLLEASGSEAALVGALDVLRPGAVAVQVGLASGTFTLPINMLVAKEIELRGTFRFNTEFATALELMGRGLIDVTPLITATLPFVDAAAAFELASDKARSMKVQLAFA